jgi:hypothetical protein
MNASALLVRGKIESSQSVVNIIADHLSELKIDARGVGSRNFR